MLLSRPLRGAGMTVCLISIFTPSSTSGLALSGRHSDSDSLFTRGLIPVLHTGSTAGHSFLGAAGGGGESHEDRMEKARQRLEEMRQRRRERDQRRADLERRHEAERREEGFVQPLTSSAALVGCIQQLADSDRFNMHSICSKMQNYEECGTLIQSILSKGNFSPLRLQEISFPLHSSTDTFKPCIAMIRPSNMRLAALLEPYFTRDCRLEVTTEQFMEVLLRDIYGETEGDDTIRKCARSVRRRAKEGIAARLVGQFVEASRLELVMVKRFMFTLNLVLYQSVVGVMAYSFLARLLNAACRVSRLCRFALLQLLSRNIPDLTRAAQSAPRALGIPMESYMNTLFRGERERIARMLGTLVSEWIVASYLRFYDQAETE